jgi:hypothetical protein
VAAWPVNLDAADDLGTLRLELSSVSLVGLLLAVLEAAALVIF